MNRNDIAGIRHWLEKSEGLADARPFLGDRRMDALVEVMLELAAQLWVTRRRLAMLEATLTEAGTLPGGAVENHRPSSEAAAEVRADRERFIAAIFRSIAELPTDSAD